MDDKKMVEGQQLPAAAEMTPGQTISPRQEAAEPKPEQASLPAVETNEQPAHATNTTEQTETTTPEEAEFEDEPSNYEEEMARSRADNLPPVSWTASEYIAHQKNTNWYAMLAVGAIVLTALVYLFTRDWLSAAVVIVAAMVFAGYSLRKPQQMGYEVSSQGLTVGTKFFPYAEFRSFSVVPEGAFASIVFMPLKRFGVQTTIYYDPTDEDRILDVISLHLPHEEHRADMLDHMMRRIRF